MDTSELFKEAKQGSAAAQKCLFDQFEEKMLLVCRRYVKASEEAEELLLDGFISSLKHYVLSIIKGDAALYVWIKKIMINDSDQFNCAYCRQFSVYDIELKTTRAKKELLIKLKLQ